MIPRIITEQEVRSAVPLDAAAIAVVEAAFAKLARGGVVMPPVQQILVDDHHGPDARPVELGEIITGQVRFERRLGDVTMCDLTGLGIQDAEIALLARRRSSDQTLGTLS